MLTMDIISPQSIPPPPQSIPQHPAVQRLQELGEAAACVHGPLRPRHRHPARQRRHQLRLPECVLLYLKAPAHHHNHTPEPIDRARPTLTCIPPQHTHNPTASSNQEDGSDTYLHRVGRAGRFGTKGLAISFISSQEDAEQLAKVQSRCVITSLLLRSCVLGVLGCCGWCV